MDSFVGVYEWAYAGGSFAVALRPNGTFYCEKYSAQATWNVVDSKLQIDWKNYGQYELNVHSSGVFEGSARGDSANWRKMTFTRGFNAIETAILGAGFGSVWSFAWERGAFQVEFRVDGYNHFVCHAYPAHSHWRLLDDETVYISWAQYGQYVLKLDAANGTLIGHGEGQPDNWRKATYLGPLNQAESIAHIPSHDSDHQHSQDCGHGHKHGNCCGHKHKHEETCDDEHYFR